MEGRQVNAYDHREVGEVKNEPHVDVLQIGCTGQGVAGFGVKGDEDEEKG